MAKPLEFACLMTPPAPTVRWDTSPGQARDAGAALGQAPRRGAPYRGARNVRRSSRFDHSLSWPSRPESAAISLATNRSERFLTPRWGASRFGFGTQGGAREAGLPWAGIPAHRWCGLLLHLTLTLTLPPGNQSAQKRSAFMPRTPIASRLWPGAMTESKR